MFVDPVADTRVLDATRGNGNHSGLPAAFDNTRPDGVDNLPQRAWVADDGLPGRISSRRRRDRPANKGAAVAGTTSGLRSGDRAAPSATRAAELRVFLFLTVVLAPALAVMLVGGLGFAIWMYQLVAGPPGGHGL
jgi:nitrate reductase NapE